MIVSCPLKEIPDRKTNHFYPPTESFMFGSTFHGESGRSVRWFIVVVVPPTERKVENDP